MIFVVLGTQKFQFNRLLEELDNLKKDGKITDEIIAQVGYSTYQVGSFPTFDFIEKDKFDQYIDQADIVICHGGTGVIVSALKKEKKVIAIPRKNEFNEHVDDHQKEIVSIFFDLGYIEEVDHISELIKAIINVEQKEYKSFKSNNDIFVNELREDIIKLSNGEGK